MSFEGNMITKIAITGGPGSGKTSVLPYVKNALEAEGYTVLTVPETATELMSGGVAPWTCGRNGVFQHCRMRLQREKERAYLEAAESMNDDKIIIVCDRGMMDTLSYMTDEDFARLTEELGESRVSLRDGYDAVFHMESAASYYTTDNNPTRIETPEEALALDARLVSAWTGNPHYRMITSCESFEEKADALICEIKSFLEEVEIERKFLIEYPDTAFLEKLPNCRKIDISQTYVTDKNGENSRVRRRGEGKDAIYIETVKKHVTDTKRVEVERRITEEEYERAIKDAASRRRVEKTRYCIMENGKYFELDIFPFWNDRAILEIELKSEDESFDIPSYVKVIREVTEEKEYRNSSFAAEY